MLAPELAAIILLEHALAVTGDALLAQHPTLIDDFQRPCEQGLVISLANRICHQGATLRETLRRYRLAVSDAATPAAQDSSDDNLF